MTPTSMTSSVIKLEEVDVTLESRRGIPWDLRFEPERGHESLS